MMTFSPYQIGKGKKDWWKAIVVTGGGRGGRTLTTVNGGINSSSCQKVIWQSTWEPEISLVGIFPKETNPCQEADVHKHCLQDPGCGYPGRLTWVPPAPISTQDTPFQWLPPVNAGTGRTQGWIFCSPSNVGKNASRISHLSVAFYWKLLQISASTLGPLANLAALPRFLLGKSNGWSWKVKPRAGIHPTYQTSSPRRRDCSC